MEPKPQQPVDPVDEWGLTVPEPPTWTEPVEAELGYTTTEDPDEDPW